MGTKASSGNSDGTVTGAESTASVDAESYDGVPWRIDPPDVGLPMLRDWHAKLAAEVDTGLRSAASLFLFSYEDAQASKFMFPPDDVSLDEDAEW